MVGSMCVHVTSAQPTPGAIVQVQSVSVGNLSAASISVGSSMSHACRDATKIT